MGIIICRKCEKNIDADGASVCTCQSCGAVHTVTGYEDTDKRSRINLAVKLRTAGEFDNANAVYSNVISEFGDDPEAYWGRCLCRYGVIYLEDDNSHKLIPICHRRSSESIFSTPDYRSAYSLATDDAKGSYENDAAEIEAYLKHCDDNTDAEQNDKCEDKDDYSDVSAFLSEKNSSQKLYWCSECHHIVDMHEGKYCNKCGSEAVEAVTVNEVYADSLKNFNTFECSLEEFADRKEMFNKILPNDYRTIHLDLIYRTSSVEMYDSFTNYDSDELDKIIKITDGSVKASFKKLKIELNDRYVEEDRINRIKYFNNLLAGKNNILDSYEKIYTEYLKKITGYSDYLMRFNEYDHQLKEARDHLNNNKRYYEDRKKKFDKCVAERSAAISANESASNIRGLEVFHKYIIWVILIIGYFICNNMFPNGSGAVKSAIAWTIIVIIAKVCLVLLCNNKEQQYLSNKESINTRYGLNDYDITLLKQYYDSFWQNLSKYESKVHSYERTAEENIAKKKNFRRSAVVTLYDCINEQEIKDFITALDKKMSAEEYSKLTKKINESMNRSIKETDDLLKNRPDIKPIMIECDNIKPFFNTTVKKEYSVSVSNGGREDEVHSFVNSLERKQNAEKRLERFI